MHTVIPSRPFPVTQERKREAHAAMVREAPDLMTEIAELRQLFPGSRLTYFSAGNLRLGASSPGIQISDDLVKSVAEAEAKKAPTPKLTRKARRR